MAAGIPNRKTKRMKKNVRRMRILLTRNCDSDGELQLSPDVSEIIDAFFASEPFGGADGAFGEAEAGFSVVTEINAVGGRFEYHLVQADYVAFAEGCDF